MIFIILFYSNNNQFSNQITKQNLHAMRQTTRIKKIGLWLDHGVARLVEPGQNNTDIHILPSQVRTRVRFRSEEADGLRPGNFRSDNNGGEIQRRFKKELLSYFKKLANTLQPYDEIFIFGPTTTLHEFHNFLLTQKNFSQKRISISRENYMTDKQLVSHLRRHQTKMQYA
jgi:hypothetical protein